MLKVRKRDSTIEEFNRDKIYTAIYKAVQASSAKYNDVLLDEIVSSVVVFHLTSSSGIVDIEKIQDSVEKALMQHGLFDTAKAYILYRNKHKNERDTLQLLDKMKPTDVPWGPLGYVTYKRTYARPVRDTTEEFQDTIKRVLLSCQTDLKVGFTNEELKLAYNYLMNLKFSVAGRFLWQMGTTTVKKLGLASLQNCAYTSINNINCFAWIFDMLMLGVGVGFSVERKHISRLPNVIDKDIVVTRNDTKDTDFIVPDSREGWVKLLKNVFEAFFITGESFSYSTILIRGAGSPIKGFGGIASGPEDLCRGIDQIQTIIKSHRGKKLNSVACLDIVNIIASVVVAGNIRRSACIALGDHDDIAYLKAKRWDLGNVPNWRAFSNNSVVCDDTSKLPDEFWEGYKGNGEPYGIVNIELAKKIGRTKDGSKYPDPDIEGVNPCLTGDTCILTNEGVRTINQLVGKQFTAIVNGEEYKSTGEGFWKSGTRSIYTITLKNGATIKATENHKFLSTNGWEEVQKLTNNSVLKLCNNTMYKWNGGKGSFIEGYIIGHLIGDGTFVQGKPILSIWLHESKDVKSYQPAIEIEKYFDTQETRSDFNGFNLARKQRDYNEYRLTCKALRNLVDKYNIDKNKRVPIHGSYDFSVGVIKGLFDTDGCVQGSQDKGVSVRLSQTELSRLLDVQKLLFAMGIESKIYKRRSDCFRNLPNGKGGMAEYLCKAFHELVISNESILKFNNCIGFFDDIHCQKMHTIFTNYKRSPNRDKFTSQIESIVKEDITEDVYDCTIPDIHCFFANGMISHNCSEQFLSDRETCCLSEIFLPNLTSFEEAKRVATTAYRICKHSLSLPCHQKSTEDVVHKNMRMGIGVTGYLQATEEQRNWLSPLYEYLREYDKLYSKDKAFPESVKLTTSKPSGTLSLLAGVTPGAHPGIYPYFIRRIRMAASNPLVDLCKSHGYHCEYQKLFDGSEDRKTMVVSFPCCYPPDTKFAKDMSAIDQLEVIRRVQHDWSDNAVSVTIYYRKEELPAIQKWLCKHYSTCLKACSFLLHSDHGFTQAPYEEISEEEYMRMISHCTPITAGKINLEDDYSSECATGACPLK